MKEAPRPGHQRGFSLIELMIAVTLGLLILLAVTNIFISSRQSFRTQEGMAQIQETGRLLNYLVYPYIRLAGYLPNPITQTNPVLIYAGNDTAVRGENNVTGTTTLKANTDTITVRYRGQDNFAGTAADGSITNCTSVGGAAGVRASDLVVSTFYVGPASNGISSLFCSVSVAGSTPDVQPLLQGVQDMQILYGVGAAAASTGDRVTQRYYTANDVPNWGAVTSVQMTITADSTEVVSGNQTVAGASNAGRLRRTFTATLQIRNRLN